ncbi:hypothetical protein ACTA71_007599 [Dictyostelium dimigraforme]
MALKESTKALAASLICSFRYFSNVLNLNSFDFGEMNTFSEMAMKLGLNELVKLKGLNQDINHQLFILMNIQIHQLQIKSKFTLSIGSKTNGFGKPEFGFECSGIVSRIGSKVTKFKVVLDNIWKSTSSYVNFQDTFGGIGLACLNILKASGFKSKLFVTFIIINHSVCLLKRYLDFQSIICNSKSPIKNELQYVKSLAKSQSL